MSLVYIPISDTDELLHFCDMTSVPREHSRSEVDGAREWPHGDEPHHPPDWHPGDLEVPQERSLLVIIDSAKDLATTGIPRRSLHAYVQPTRPQRWPRAEAWASEAQWLASITSAMTAVCMTDPGRIRCTSADAQKSRERD